MLQSCLLTLDISQVVRVTIRHSGDMNEAFEPAKPPYPSLQIDTPYHSGVQYWNHEPSGQRPHPTSPKTKVV